MRVEDKYVAAAGRIRTQFDVLGPTLSLLRSVCQCGRAQNTWDVGRDCREGIGPGSVYARRILPRGPGTCDSFDVSAKAVEPLENDLLVTVSVQHAMMQFRRQGESVYESYFLRPLQKFPGEALSACAVTLVSNMSAATAGEPCSQGMQRHVVRATQKFTLTQAPAVMRSCAAVWLPYVIRALFSSCEQTRAQVCKHGGRCLRELCICPVYLMPCIT